MNKKEKIPIIRDKKVKRLKTQHARPNLLSITPVNVDCFKLEEQEPAGECLTRFLDSSGKFVECCFGLFEAKLSKNMTIQEKEELTSQLRPHVCMHVMCLKKINRLDKHQWKKSRDSVSEKKQKSDVLHLQYQNLLYEATHLQKEVTKCMEFKSKDEEIDLVSLEEFYRDAPENISKPDVTKLDSHELRLARLLWESEQRKRFAVKLKEYEITKQQSIQIQKKLQDKLSSINPILKAILQAAEPFQGKIGMPFQAMPLKHRNAKFLPTHLYIFYVQMSAYQEHHSGKKISISIEGNVDDVKTLNAKLEDLSEESGESDREDRTEMVDTLRHTGTNKKEEIKKDILMKHPMSVVVTIEKKSTIKLEFKYLVHLHIITVSVRSLSPEPMSTELVGDLLRTDIFLNCLFPGDDGHESPNLTSVHLLQTKFGLEDCPFNNESTGWPYLWAQKLAGLDFLSPTFDLKFAIKQIPPTMEKVVTAIFSRLVSRHQLYNQMTSFEQRINVPPKFAGLYPSSTSSQLKKWLPTSWTEVSKCVNVGELQSLGIVCKDSLFYKTELERGSALLSVLITISPEYPTKPPVLLLKLIWKGSHTAVSSFALRVIPVADDVLFVERTSNTNPAPSPALSKTKKVTKKTTTMTKKPLKSRQKVPQIVMKCCICLDAVKDILKQRVSIIHLSCGHLFCKPCMLRWRTMRFLDHRIMICPVCRCQLFGIQRVLKFKTSNGSE